jgi:hypothetical protein
MVCGTSEVINPFYNEDAHTSATLSTFFARITHF